MKKLSKLELKESAILNDLQMNNIVGEGMVMEVVTLLSQNVAVPEWTVLPVVQTR